MRYFILSILFCSILYASETHLHKAFIHPLNVEGNIDPGNEMKNIYYKTLSDALNNKYEFVKDNSAEYIIYGKLRKLVSVYYLSCSIINSKTNIAVKSETAAFEKKEELETQINSLAVLLTGEENLNFSLEFNPQPAEKENEANPKAVLYYNQGNEFGRKRDYENALESFTKAIQIDPKFYNAYNNRAAVYQVKEDYAKAIADYTKAIELNPKFFSAFTNRGNIYIMLGKFNEALADYTKSLELNEYYPDAYLNLAMLFDRTRNYGQAIKNYELFLKYAKRDDKDIEYAKYRLDILKFK